MVFFVHLPLASLHFMHRLRVYLPGRGIVYACFVRVPGRLRLRFGCSGDKLGRRWLFWLSMLGAGVEFYSLALEVRCLGLESLESWVEA